MHSRASDRRSKRSMDLVAAILDCASVDDLLQDILPQLSLFLGSETACGSEMYQEKGKPWLGRTATVNMSGGVMCRYNDDFAELDPISSSAYTRAGSHRIGLNHARVMRMSDWLRWGDSRHKVFINEFLRRERLDHVLGIMLRASVETAPVMVFGFHRDGRHQDFSPEDLELAQIILPALLARIDNFALRSEMESLQGKTTSAAGAALQLDIREFGEQKAVTSVAALGRPILYPGLFSRVQALSRGEGTTTVARGVLTALGLNGGVHNEKISVRFETTGRLRLEVQPSGPADLIAEWSVAQGLSRRETDVIRYIAAGKRNAEIAGALGLSIRTVENHLRSAYSKVGVSSRGQMIHKIVTAAGSPI